jgi:hypothetical protein
MAPNPNFFTRLGSDGNNSEIDFILSNKLLTTVRSINTNIEANIQTDHLCIISSIDINELQAKRLPKSQRKQKVLKKDLNEDEIIKILMDDRWPNTSFATIATEQKLTKF